MRPDLEPGGRLADRLVLALALACLVLAWSGWI